MAQKLRVDSIPAGLRPLGISAAVFGDVASGQGLYFVVANSGENSVSIYDGPRTSGLYRPPLRVKVEGIPGPYGVSHCGTFDGRVLVTSPSANSIFLVRIPEGTILGSAKVGPEPYSASCRVIDNNRTAAVVSNFGDSSVSIVDLDTLTVIAQFSNVPGTRSWRGVGTFVAGSHFIAMVAGTDANILTLVDLSTFKVLTQVPMRRPTSVRAGALIDPGSSVNGVFVASAGDNVIYQFDPNTLQQTVFSHNMTTPRDFVVNYPLGVMATVGESNSIARMLWYGVDRDTIFETISGIPGPAGAASYGNRAPVSGNLAGAVLVTSPDTNQIFVLQADGPATPPNDFRVVNAGSSVTGPGAPGGLATTFVQTGASQAFTAASVPLPRTLGGVTMRVGGTLQFVNLRWDYSPTGSLDAPLLYVNPNQVNFQIPPGISPGDLIPAQLTQPDGSTLLTTLRVAPTAPGIFTVLMNGQGQAAALNQDNSQNFGTNPAKRGSVIQIFATGAGETDPPLLPGEAAPASGNPLVFTRVLPQVTIGGTPAPVQFSGMAPGWVGLWQINVEVPANVTPGAAIPLVITAGGISSNTVTIAVE